MIRNLWRQRELISQLTKREILTRYRGSLLGILWSLLTPLLMLVVYTFVFGVIFKPRWTGPVEGQAQFALILFCGLSIFGIFSEVISRAPALIVNNPNYVKRVVFPIEILPLTILGSALVNGIISLGILIAASLIFTGQVHATVLYLPLVILPLLLFSLGLGWFFASTGVYFRDIAQIMPIAISALMFLSPIFYPVSAIPEKLRFVYGLNPISYVVEDARQIIIWGNQPNWIWLIAGTACGAIIAILGYLWFQKTKKGFVDVI